MDIQRKIKHNVENFQTIIHEMSNWEEEMKRKEIDLLQNEEMNSSYDIPPIRAKILKEERITSDEKVNEFTKNFIAAEECSNREKSLVEKDLGNEFVKAKKWADAIIHYSTAIEYYAEDPAFFCNRAQCYLQTKQWTDAVADCNRALELDSNYVKAYYRKGLALKELNKIKEARLNLQKAHELEPNDENVKNDLLLLNELLKGQLSAHNGIDAANSFDTSLTDRQKREKSLDEKERGNALVAQKKWNDAIRHYTEAINCFSKDPTFYCNRALCFLHIKQLKEAETDCTIALQLDPKYVKAYHRRGLALKEMNQLQEAVEDFKKALVLDPKNTYIQKDLAKIEKRLGDSGALKMSLGTTFEEPKMNDKDLAYLKKERGNLFVQKKDWKSAIECYTEACKLYPEDVSFNLNRALCFLKTKEPKKALLDCTLVLEEDPKNIKAYFRRAAAHEALENWSKAHDDLLEAFKLDASDNAIQNRLTRLEKKMGILPSETVENEKDVDVIEEPHPEFVPTKRVSGEKFIKLGGRFVQPAKKSPHQVSTKPLKTIKIMDKNEDPLKSAFDEISVTDIINVSNRDEEKRQDEKYSENLKIISESEDVAGVDVSELPIPKTSTQFVSLWDKLNSLEAQYSFLKKINADDLPQIFKESLESYTFSDIIEVLATQFVKANEPVYRYLLGLSHVKRIKAMLLFASEEDNANIKAIFSHAEKLNEVPDSELKTLKSFYYC